MVLSSPFVPVFVQAPNETQPALQTYADVLQRVCGRRASSNLHPEALALSNRLISEGMSTQDVVMAHVAAVRQVLSPNAALALAVAQEFLVEVLVEYGQAHSALTDRLIAEADRAAAVSLTRVEEAQRADRDRLEMLGGFSHELGSPLTVIKANVASIRRFLEEHEIWPDELSQREDDVEFAVGRLVDLRDDLLAVSRNEPRELDLGPRNLNRSLQRVVRWAAPSALEKGIALTESYGDDGHYVVGDEWAIQSIFGNLISNAIRYTPNGGSVTVKTLSEGSTVVAEVTDTGMGIPAESQHRIFERFYRTDGAKSAVPFGIGLGLAITRDLVSASGGSIAVTSSVGVGSTFRVTLQRHDFSQEG